VDTGFPKKIMLNQTDRAGRGKFLRVPFKPMLLGASDATGEANLAAHRCSNFLCR